MAENSNIKNILPSAGAIGALVIAAIGMLADTTSLLGSSVVRDLISASFPYISAFIAVFMAYLAYSSNKRANAAEAALRRRWGMSISITRRLVRVLGTLGSITRVATVRQERIQPLFDEMASTLPVSFHAHHKFSVARPNHDGTFTMLATRGMDPASVSSIQAQASWMTGRSFYASLLNDPLRAEYKWFSMNDSAYVDTRSAGNSTTRPSSSSSHFLIALRDEDLYAGLPKKTIGIVSVGIPKGVMLDEPAQVALFEELLPVSKAIEALLVAESLQFLDEASNNKDDPKLNQLGSTET